MATTEIDGVYYPELDDLDQPNVYLAAMAQSIEGGIGARLRQQELAVGLKAGIAPGNSIPREGSIAPFTIRSDNGGFIQGMQISGGVATVQVKGMYVVAASAGIQPFRGNPNNTNRTVALTLFKNSTELAGAETLANIDYYQTAAATTVISCEPGDTLHAKWHSAAQAGTTANAAMANASSLQYLSIALIQALPA